MVVKLTGNVNGSAIIFERVQGDEWKATVPASLNGVYIVELLAVDEAGNEAYWAKYILTIDLAALCVHLEPYPYWAELLQPEYYATLIQAGCGGAR